MDSDEEFENPPVWKGVPGTIILINIFKTAEFNTFTLGHEATCRLLKQYMRSASNQNIAVCVFGIEESNASLLDCKSITEIIPLAPPSLEDYKKFRDTEISSFKEAKQLIFSEVLRQCSKMFTNCKRQLSYKCIHLLTPLHVPPAETDKRLTITQVEDLVDSNIEIRLINVSPENYSPDPFFDKFYAKANKGLILDLPKPIANARDIEKIMFFESHRNLALAKLNFAIGSDVQISVALYKLIKSGQTYQKKSYLHSETNEMLTSSIKTTKVNINAENMDLDEAESEQNAVPLLKSELLYYVEYGGEKIEFTQAEKKSMDNPFGPPGLKLLGFKPKMIVCKEKWFTKPGYFLFPNENDIEGSTVAFKAMHKACAEMGVVAVCVLCPRVNAKPIHVALSPCTKPLNLDVEIGFYVIVIPFVESVRDFDVNEGNDDCFNVENKNKELMKEIITKTQFDYRADMFENPKLQSEYRAVEAKALNEDEVEPFVDTTKPIISNFKDLRVDLFEELFGPFGALSVKRSAAASCDDAKRSKIEIDQELLTNRINFNTVKEYTVAELKKILKSKDIKDLTGLRKNELVDLVYKFFKT
ncbi:X-ray repair cross-complementing protein 6 [Aricia agestis]|uniref:X-ray repair cross-complementing protein 6 n=1 Tax=Aricia agestis TaxID=91739 RepID=UPI001C203B28|nr:X-ray repair cross-complementing protein 6 [Aricia agestis]